MFRFLPAKASEVKGFFWQSILSLILSPGCSEDRMILVCIYKNKWQKSIKYYAEVRKTKYILELLIFHSCKLYIYYIWTCNYSSKVYVVCTVCKVILCTSFQSRTLVARGQISDISEVIFFCCRICSSMTMTRSGLTSYILQSAAY